MWSGMVPDEQADELMQCQEKSCKQLTYVLINGYCRSCDLIAEADERREKDE